jgi:hypothetical protein
MIRGARVGVAGIVVVTVVGALWRMKQPPPTPRDTLSPRASLEAIVPEDLQRLIRARTSVEAVLVERHPRFGERDPEFSRVLHVFRLRSAPVRLSSSQAGQLASLLLDRSNYDTVAVDCAFMPDVDYRFVSEVDTLHAVICHSCDQLVLSSESARRGGGAYVYAIAARLEDLSHTLFPADSTITTVWRRGQEEESIRVRSNR